MKENLFRKESMERINSPGELNRYIRVAEPGTWLILASVVVLLLGTIVWSIFGTIETKAEACAVADADGVVCYISSKDAAKVEAGMAVTIGGAQGSIAAVSREVVDIPAEAKAYLSGEACCAAEAEIDGIAPGTYEAEVIVERISPISFVLK